MAPAIFCDIKAVEVFSSEKSEAVISRHSLSSPAGTLVVSSENAEVHADP